MDINNHEDTETCRSSTKLKIYDEDTDFISDMPDPILVHILSFLPTNDAIQTVLLRRFANLWREVSVLDLNSCPYHDCEDEECSLIDQNEKFIDIIHHVLKLHDSASLDVLRLNFCFELRISKDEALFGDPHPYNQHVLTLEKDAADQIGKLIGYSIRKKVKVLDLNLKGCSSVLEYQQYDLPDVFNSTYLVDLRLAACDIRSCRTINLKSLKVLLLNKVSLSDEVMAKVLVGCPFLEDLSLIDCYGLTRLTCGNPSLKKMLIILREDEYVIIACPYVSSLKIYGWIERAHLLNVSSVVDVSIYFSVRFKYERKEYFDVVRLLQKVSQCKTFNPCTWSILVMSIWSFMNMPCPSFGWKNLTLQLNLTKWHHPGLSLLFRNTQSLETLTMYICHGSPVNIPRLESEWIQAHDFDGENFWESQEEATFPFLESIMIYGYVDEPYVIQMVKFLLTSAKKLQKLVISTKGSVEADRYNMCFDGPIKRQRAHFTPELLLELSQKFKDLPRASPDAVIYFY